MKIYLDDARKIDCKKYKYNRVYTYQQCIDLIDLFKENLEFISLDYHLGSKSNYSGYDVLVYMYQNNISPKQINIHSDHIEGVGKMYEYAKRCFENTIITKSEIKEI